MPSFLELCTGFATRILHAHSVSFFVLFLRHKTDTKVAAIVNTRKICCLHVKYPREVKSIQL